MESMLDSVGQVGVVETELRGCVVDAEILRPWNRRDTKTADRVKHPNGFDCDELPTILLGFVDAGEPFLLELVSIVAGSIVARWLLVKRNSGKGVFVSSGLPILHVFEDRKKELHALSGQKADARDHTGDTARCEGAAGEADEDDLVTVDIVGADERVTLPYVLPMVSHRQIHEDFIRCDTSATPFPKAPPEKESDMVLPVPTPDW